MIIDRLENMNRYRMLSPLLLEMVDELAGGRIALDTEYSCPPDESGLSYFVSEYYTKEPEEVFLEAHRRFMDLQYIVSGKERIRISTDSSLTQLHSPYDIQRDIEFYTGQGEEFLLRAGYFIILFPNELHGPCIADGEPQYVRKFVGKIPV